MNSPSRLSVRRAHAYFPCCERFKTRRPRRVAFTLTYPGLSDGAGSDRHHVDREAIATRYYYNPLPHPVTSQTAAVVAAHGAGLVEATPARPVQHSLRWGQHAHDQAVDEPTHLGDGERDQAVVGGQVRHQCSTLSALPGRWECTTARYASANI